MADAGQHLTIDGSAAPAPTLSTDLKGDELYDAAKSAYTRGNYKVSIELLQKVVAADPKHKTAWMDLGRNYMVLRQTECSRRLQEAGGTKPLRRVRIRRAGLGVHHRAQVRRRRDGI
jgi:Flp pilus assembly protein TadD